jgi:hypothetical protein
MVPMFAARVADLKPGSAVRVTCRNPDCGLEAELETDTLRRRLKLTEYVKRVLPRFRCTRCGRKNVDLDARHALGHFG